MYSKALLSGELELVQISAEYQLSWLNTDM